MGTIKKDCSLRRLPDKIEHTPSMGSYESYAAGFDDMLPTILECLYPSFPRQGHRIPDNGEVWSVEWQCGMMDDYLHIEVNGVRLPYNL